MDEWLELGDPSDVRVRRAWSASLARDRDEDAGVFVPAQTAKSGSSDAPARRTRPAIEQRNPESLAGG
jgi:hypothetical protein